MDFVRIYSSTALVRLVLVFLVMLSKALITGIYETC